MPRKEEKRKNLNLSLSNQEIEELKKISIKHFGRENKTGMVRIWIMNATKNNKTV